jgi:predicted dehydrogenase
MGNQGTAAGPYRRALELIQQGFIGDVREVHIWNESGGADRKETPKDTRDVPPYLNWDLWLGPAKARPFSSAWLSWGGWRDFGTGALGNWASHTANLAFRALKVNTLWSAKGAAPIEVQAKIPGINRISFPKWEVITWKIPARADLPAIDFNWYNGRGPDTVARLERLLGRDLDWGDKGPKKWTDFAGTLIIGSKGTIHSTGHNATFKLLPEEPFRGVQTDRPERETPSRGHERDFLDACKGGKPAWAAFDYAGPLNEFLQIANIATQFDGPITYEPAAGKITNNADADALITPEFRQGWKL